MSLGEIFDKGFLQTYIVCGSLTILGVLIPPVLILVGAAVAYICFRVSTLEAVKLALFSMAVFIVLSIVLNSLSWNSYSFVQIIGVDLLVAILVRNMLTQGLFANALNSSLLVFLAIITLHLVVFALLVPDDVSLWVSVISSIQDIYRQSGFELPMNDVSVPVVASFLTGILGVFILFSWMLGINIAINWFQKSTNESKNSDNISGFCFIELPNIILPVVGGMLVLSYLFEIRLFFNLSIVFLGSYFLIGIATLKVILARNKFVMIVIYVLIATFFYLTILIIGLGLVDSLFKIRKKIIKI